MSTPLTPIERLLAESERRKWKDADLCRRLKITQQRLNNWKDRGLPAKAAVDIAPRLSLSLDWLWTGKGPAPQDAPGTAESLALHSVTPDRQARVLELFDQLTPAQQDQIIVELKAHVAANVAVVRHFSGKKLRTTDDARIEQTFGMPSKNS